MAGKVATERVEELDKKIKQLQAQKQQLLNRVKEQERKKRTRNLIQIGGVMANMGMVSLEQANAFKDRVMADEKVKAWFEKLMAAHASDQQDPQEQQTDGEPEGQEKD